VSIERKAASGVAWNVLMSVVTRVVQLGGTLVLTRFIAPAEYGEVSAAIVCVQTANQLTTLSLGQYLIANKSPPKECFQAAIVHFVLGVIGMVVVLSIRGPLGDLVEVPDMGRLMPGFALALVIDRVRLIPERMLVRDLRFRTVAILNSVGEMTFTGTALALAWKLGGGAIVAGAIARSTIATIAFIAIAPRREWLSFAWPNLKIIKALVGYGIWIMFGSFSDRISSTWDNLLMARLFGPGIMGQYNLAFSLAETPLVYVADRIGDVLMPSFAKMEPQERPAAVVRAAAIMSIVVAPLGVGLGAVAPSIIVAFFDPRWAEMAPMLMILSVMTIFHPAPWAAISYLQTEKKTRPIMITSVIHAVILLLSVYILGKLGGPLWGCVAVGVGSALHATITIILTGMVTSLPIRSYLVAVSRPLLACAPMFLAVTAVRNAIGSNLHVSLSLVLQILTGGIVYVVSLFIVARHRTMELVNLVRGVVQQRRARKDGDDGDAEVLSSGS
jgi:lipopolysaccharide exporter